VKILVAGATGLIGRVLVAQLARAHEVHALARSAQTSPESVLWHTVDLSTPPDSWRLPAKWDVAIYLAQSAGYRDFPAQAADMVAINVQAPIALLDASRRCGASAFVLASTANVYGVSHHPISERGGINPTSFYARTRRAAEMLAEPFAEHLAVTVARLFTVYGPGQKPDTLIMTLIDRVIDGRAVQVQGNRGLLLSPIYLDDAAAALAQLAERPAAPHDFNIVNVAGDRVVGLAELAAMVGTIVGREPAFDRVTAHEPGGWAGDTALLRAMTSWMPATSLERGLQHTVAARVA
jgi:nucleoside-diphosphate-sugar epimerase